MQTFLEAETHLAEAVVAPGITLADTGLGTTFERWALNRLLQRLHGEYQFTRVFEGPDDGMTGIAGLNSLILGRLGCRVTLQIPQVEKTNFTQPVWERYAPQAELQIIPLRSVDTLPYADGQFDLAWNFNVMTRVASPLRLLQEMARISSRTVMIFVPNRQNYAFWLHRLHHQVAKEAWDHGQVDLMHPQPWTKLFSEAGLRLREVMWMDAPWWPDIVDLSKLIADFFPPLKGMVGKAKPENRYRWPADGLPYYQAELFPEVHTRMEKLAYFENMRRPVIKKRFAHHVGLIGEKV